MKFREGLAIMLILGIVLSAALLRGLVIQSQAVAGVLTALSLGGTVLVWSALVCVIIGENRSRQLLLTGAGAFLAALLWLNFLIATFQVPRRWLLVTALAWMATPFITLLFASLGRWLCRRVDPLRR